MCTYINRHNQVFANTDSYNDHNLSDLDEDNIIHSIDSKQYKVKQNKNKKKRNNEMENKYDNDEYNEIENEINDYSATKKRNESVEYDDLDQMDNLSVSTTPLLIKLTLSKPLLLTSTAYAVSPSYILNVSFT